VKQAQDTIGGVPKRRGLCEVTDRLVDWLARQGIARGLLTVFIRHTSASLLIQENADADVARDLENYLAKLVPEDERLYRHNAEGPDDMPAHIKGALTQTHLSIPISDGRMVLGTWQGVYLFEHRRQPRRRELALHLLGE